MAKKFFVYTCDTALDGQTAAQLASQSGLTLYHDFDYSGPEAWSGLFAGNPGERHVDAENLLVFTDAFDDDEEKAVLFARMIHEANPRAKIYFRSECKACHDPVFANSIARKPEVLLALISMFKRGIAGAAAA